MKRGQLAEEEVDILNAASALYGGKPFMNHIPSLSFDKQHKAGTDTVSHIHASSP